MFSCLDKGVHYTHLFNKCLYDRRTIVLAHYGFTKNKGMFEFLWNKEQDLRNDDLLSLLNYPSDYSTECLMNVYATKYSNQKEIQKIRVWHIENAAQWGPNSTFSEFLKKILPRSGFNIWNITFVSSKKILSDYHTKKKTKKCRKKIVKAVCESKDVDLLLAIMGGIIEPRAFKCVFTFSNSRLIDALREKEAFIEDVPDKHGNTFHDYERALVLGEINSRYKHHGRLRG